MHATPKLHVFVFRVRVVSGKYLFHDDAHAVDVSGLRTDVIAIARMF